MKDINRLVLLQTHPISLSISTWVHVHKSFLPCPFFELQEAALSKDMKVESPTLSQVEIESHQNLTCQLVSACVASTFAIQSYCSINHFRNAMPASSQGHCIELKIVELKDHERMQIAQIVGWIFSRGSFSRVWHSKKVCTEWVWTSESALQKNCFNWRIGYLYSTRDSHTWLWQHNANPLTIG